MEEVWKDIKGYEGKYQVSNYGRIRNINSNKILKPNKHKTGYLNIDLHGKNKYMPYIHVLVANAFIEKPNDTVEVNHIDGNKENNCVDNLEWVTKSQNIIHAYEHNLRKDNKPCRCIEDGKEFNSLAEAGKYYNICWRGIAKVCNKKQKTCGKRHFEFI